MTHEPQNVVATQNSAHGEGHDYVKGSPHLRHTVLRTMIADQLAALVSETIARKGSCHVLEVGAGHGTFSDFLLAAGARVTVTEASEASAKTLTEKYADRDDVEVFFDTTGGDVFEREDRFDGVVCASLLHHIPDYVTFVGDLSGLLDEDGWFYSVQDPTYYPRRSRRTQLLGRGTYFLWRLGQGNYKRGLSTRVRRAKGEWSETEASDLVEYHVVRDGVDELALVTELEKHFTDVELFTYWSTQGPLFQKMFAGLNPPTDFGLIGRHRTA
ncbi:bifunctional 2-polyprenyl-6-hydroxyphenol methylase/3-demethylubiquinol 3-O-methyltransferase UbiG [Aeromicrobium sp. Leaf350]|uniref:class I SAM-dependent methyltransferase n=1 Tax=Aeromicrobium sp. Leaf350 TaxID=2876565 RepID=UPI001E420631|nr:class I SAM-dependent methyltransferase [Aeromicrobium sp. Leaf350]